MKALVNTGPGQLVMQDWPTPAPGLGQVRIKTGATGICATDLEMIDGWARTGFPAIPGHEWAGVVDAVGPGVDAALVGRRCVAENVLADGGEVGFEHPGAYGAYFLTEAANVQPLPDDFPLDAAALIEPLAVSVRGMNRLRPADPARALVFGDGPIGLLMTALLHRAGVGEVVMVGGHTDRLALAVELGARATVNYHQIEGDLVRALVRQAGRFPNVIEASGSARALHAGLEVAAHGGKVLVLGDYGGARADFAWNHVLLHELDLIGSNASAGAWPEAVRLATQGEVPLERLITHRLPAARYSEGIAVARRRECIKVVLEW